MLNNFSIEILILFCDGIGLVFLPISKFILPVCLSSVRVHVPF
jgi:hypothetical protein